MIEVDDGAEHRVERDPHRELEHHRRAACEGVDPGAAEQGLHLLLLLDLVVPVLLADLLHLRLQLLHLAHGGVLLDRQRQEHRLDADREHDDRHAPHARQAVEPAQEHEHEAADGLRQAAEPAPVDGIGQIDLGELDEGLGDRELREHRVDLGADVDPEFVALLLARAEGDLAPDQGVDHREARVVAADDAAGHALARHDRLDEVLGIEGDPIDAALDDLVLLFDVVEVEVLELLGHAAQRAVDVVAALLGGHAHARSQLDAVTLLARAVVADHDLVLGLIAIEDGQGLDQLDLTLAPGDLDAVIVFGPDLTGDPRPREVCLVEDKAELEALGALFEQQEVDAGSSLGIRELLGEGLDGGDQPTRAVVDVDREEIVGDAVADELDLRGHGGRGVCLLRGLGRLLVDDDLVALVGACLGGHVVALLRGVELGDPAGLGAPVELRIGLGRRENVRVHEHDHDRDDRGERDPMLHLEFWHGDPFRELRTLAWRGGGPAGAAGHSRRGARDDSARVDAA